MQRATRRDRGAERHVGGAADAPTIMLRRSNHGCRPTAAARMRPIDFFLSGHRWTTTPRIETPEGQFLAEFSRAVKTGATRQVATVVSPTDGAPDRNKMGSSAVESTGHFESVLFSRVEYREVWSRVGGAVAARRLQARMSRRVLHAEPLDAAGRKPEGVRIFVRDTRSWNDRQRLQMPEAARRVGCPCGAPAKPDPAARAEPTRLSLVLCRPQTKWK